ncbi:MAG: hypothetical protein AcusKO_49570 [Acuticoccus sp.]
MTPKSKLAIAVVTLSLGGAGAAYALTATPGGAPAAGASVVHTVDGRGDGWRRGHHRGGHRMRGRGPHGMMIREVMRQADTNNDEALTQAEVDTFIAGLVETADADGSGTITLEEFETIWLEMTRRPMVRAFQFLDTDGSAEIGDVEITERFGDMVAKMDRNDDGKLDRGDRGRRFGKRGPGPRGPDRDGDDD